MTTKSTMITLQTTNDHLTTPLKAACALMLALIALLLTQTPTNATQSGKITYSDTITSQYTKPNQLSKDISIYVTTQHDLKNTSLQQYTNTLWKQQPQPQVLITILANTNTVQVQGQKGIDTNLIQQLISGKRDYIATIDSINTQSTTIQNIINNSTTQPQQNKPQEKTPLKNTIIPITIIIIATTGTLLYIKRRQDTKRHKNFTINTTSS